MADGRRNGQRHVINPPPPCSFPNLSAVGTFARSQNHGASVTLEGELLAAANAPNYDPKLAAAAAAALAADLEAREDSLFDYYDYSMRSRRRPITAPSTGTTRRGTGGFLAAASLHRPTPPAGDFKGEAGDDLAASMVRAATVYHAHTTTARSEVAHRHCTDARHGATSPYLLSRPSPDGHTKADGSLSHRHRRTGLSKRASRFSVQEPIFLRPRTATDRDGATGGGGVSEHDGSSGGGGGDAAAWRVANYSQSSLLDQHSDDYHHYLRHSQRVATTAAETFARRRAEYAEAVAARQARRDLLDRRRAQHWIKIQPLRSRLRGTLAERRAQREALELSISEPYAVTKVDEVRRGLGRRQPGRGRSSGGSNRRPPTSRDGGSHHEVHRRRARRMLAAWGSDEDSDAGIPAGAARRSAANTASAVAAAEDRRELTEAMQELEAFEVRMLTSAASHLIDEILE